MQSLEFTGQYSHRDNRIRVSVPVLSFQEEQAYIIYTPALDIYGTGNTEVEAKQSFEVALGEFFTYTIAKNTLKSELIKLGWTLKGGKKSLKLRLPDLEEVLSRRPDIKDVMQTKEYRSYQQSIAMPAFA